MNKGDPIALNLWKPQKHFTFSSSRAPDAVLPGPGRCCARTTDPPGWTPEIIKNLRKTEVSQHGRLCRSMLAHLEASWGHVGLILAPTWPSWPHLGALLGYLRLSWSPSWLILGAAGRHEPCKNCREKTMFCDMTLKINKTDACFTILRPCCGHVGPSEAPSWAMLSEVGAILGSICGQVVPSWAHVGPSWPPNWPLLSLC